MRWRWPLWAVMLPIVGLLVLVGRAEYAARSGPAWQIPIEGYDPRDLLHGRYLLYQFRFSWEGEPECGTRSDDGEPSLSRGCCLCLTRVDGGGLDPPVRQIPCDRVDACDGWLRSEAVVPPRRHYVPETRAGALERALAEREASVELRCAPNGRPAITGLVLDGRPWQEQLGD